LRRLGTHALEKEHYALKLLRGDFDATNAAETRDFPGLLAALDR
jgi:hypothetical protein